MEIIEEEIIDPRDNEPVIVDLSVDKIKLLKKRGFFPTASNLIDDTYYNIYKEYAKYSTLLKGNKTVQQLIDMPYDEMERVLFMKDSMMAMPVIFLEDEIRWRDSFGNRDGEKYYDVDPLCLEPYVAKYVRAINRCGMKTFYSCDGWHMESRKSRAVVILFRDRYSKLWHKQLCEHSIIKKLCHWRYETDAADLSTRILLPHEDDHIIDIYQRILDAGDYFINNCKVFMELKNAFVDKVSGHEMDSLLDTEVESRFSEYITDNFI